jgi:hypothetical protein
MRRYDITLCYKSKWIKGEPKPNSELGWFSPRKLPTRTGGNYKEMIGKAFS